MHASPSVSAGRYVMVTFINVRCSDRWMVGIAGIPGSGKTSLAKHLCEKVQAKANLEVGSCSWLG